MSMPLFAAQEMAEAAVVAPDAAGISRATAPDRTVARSAELAGLYARLDEAIAGEDEILEGIARLEDEAIAEARADWPGAGADGTAEGKRILCPFTVVIDSREQAPYRFKGIRANKDQGNAVIEVPTIRFGLPVGDYMIMGMPQCVLERKSREDLYGSVARRENFEDRLERMGEKGYAAVVVEAEFMDCIGNPPPFTKLAPKSLGRTIMAWTQRYPTVHWWFMPGRESAEILVYRLLERWWSDHEKEGI